MVVWFDQLDGAVDACAAAGIPFCSLWVWFGWSSVLNEVRHWITDHAARILPVVDRASATWEASWASRAAALTWPAVWSETGRGGGGSGGHGRGLCVPPWFAVSVPVAVNDERARDPRRSESQSPLSRET